MRSFSKICFNRNKHSALAERFEQILSEKIDCTTKSLIDQDPTLQDLHGKYHVIREEHSFKEAQIQGEAQQNAFEKQYQKQLGYLKSEHLLRSKEDRIIASGHWDGTERVQDTALRMIMDSVPKSKKIKRSKSLFTPPKPFGARMSAAKEGSLDYKLAKEMTAEEKEKAEFKELYREKLLGPAMFVDYTSSNTAMGMIGNMASARINAVIDRKTGKFEGVNMEKVRGKPLDRERLANSTDSSYFMNQILKNQECLPVWIENQQGIDREITIFRQDLQRKLFRALVDCLPASAKRCKEDIRHYLMQTNRDFLLDTASKQLMKQDNRYIQTKIEDLNRGVRNYNLQCPSTGLHKWKLTQLREIEQSFENILGDLENILEDYFKATEATKKSIVKSENSFLSLFGSSGQGSSSHGSRGTQNETSSSGLGLGFWKSVKSIFSNPEISNSRQV